MPHSSSPALAWRTPRDHRHPEDLRWRRLLRVQLIRHNLWEFAVALFSLASVPVAVFADPGLATSAVGHMIGHLAPLWLTMYAMGCALIVTGLLKLSPRAEVIGLILFAGAMLTDGVAALVYSGGGGGVGALTFLALAFAATMRVREVWRLATTAAHRTGEHGP